MLRSKEHSKGRYGGLDYKMEIEREYGSIKERDDNDPQNVYLNIYMTNNSTVPGTGGNTGYVVPNSLFFPITFRETRTQPILPNMNKYLASVIRFKIPSNYSPLFVFQPNEYIIAFSSSTNTGAVSTAVVHTPSENPGISAPYGNNGVWDVGNYIKDVNSAFATVNTAYGGAQKPPFFSFNSVTQLFTLYAQADSFYPQASSGIKIWFNPALMNFFDNQYNRFWNNATSNPSSVLDNAFNIFIQDTTTNLMVDPFPDSPTYAGLNMYAMTQTAPSLQFWNDLEQIIITTNLIPINSEVITFNDDANLLSAQGSTSATQSILDDFEPDQTTQLFNREYFQFNSTYDLRWADITGQGDLRDVDINVIYRDRYNNILPFFLSFGCVCSIKIQFRRKDLFQ